MRTGDFENYMDSVCLVQGINKDHVLAGSITVDRFLQTCCNIPAWQPVLRERTAFLTVMPDAKKTVLKYWTEIVKNAIRAGYEFA